MKDREDTRISEAELLQRLGQLPRHVAPRNDPWPQVLDRITGEAARTAAPGRGWFRVAAAVALAFAVGIILGKSLPLASPGNSPVDATVQAQPPAGGVAGLGAALAGTEREYQAAFGEFVHIGRSAESLQPATLDAIQRDWQEMLDAERALSTALKQYPDNPWLNQRMLELRERQLAMLKQLAGLDHASRRTEI